MLITTHYGKKKKHYIYETEEQHKAALLAILVDGWKHLPSEFKLLTKENAADHFGQKALDALKMDASAYRRLPTHLRVPIMQLKRDIAQWHKEQYAILNAIATAQELFAIPKKEALRMTVISEHQKKSAIIVAAEEINRFLHNEFEKQLYTESVTEQY